MMGTRLLWHRYLYYPYEKELASREISALLNILPVREVAEGVELESNVDIESAKRLTYFAGFANGQGVVETLQSRLENCARSTKKRQSTRYSVHGLHEYKGKFNPQVVRAILNIFAVRAGDRVFDPFSGSGTTLIECAHVGAFGYGTDLNPLAVFIANAKLQALVTPVQQIETVVRRLAVSINRVKRWETSLPKDARGLYLRSWFDTPILKVIELVAAKITDTAGPLAPFFLTIASNLLRDYSLQDPNDLRIRRRKTALPSTPFSAAFLTACRQSLDRLKAVQQLLGADMPLGKAVLCDVNTLSPTDLPGLFDAAITSPPYAMALPYIDTQRLSLVWLNLIQPNRILLLESELIGSREMRGSDRRELGGALTRNSSELREAEAAFCMGLQQALGPRDGFRRKAVPSLLYRYFAHMQASFRSVRAVMKPNAPFALIVGHNHTTLGGIRRDIDTPRHLTSIAESVGWRIDEIIPLQTYHRYGYHMSNAVAAETLLLLRNAPAFPVTTATKRAKCSAGASTLPVQEADARHSPR
jgi:site-specific DNA-methyltransferase (cytosine-N4-specific)